MSLLPGKFYLDDFFDDFTLPKMPKMELMKTDVYEKGGNIHIEMDVPGFNKEDIKIDVEDGILTIEAEKSESKEDKEGKNYYRRERTYGSFKRQFNVGSVKEHEINAKWCVENLFPKRRKERNKEIYRNKINKIKKGSHQCESFIL